MASSKKAKMDRSVSCAIVKGTEMEIHMRQEREMRLCRALRMGVLSLLLAAVLVLAADRFSMECFAASAAKVTANTANIRKSADSTSEVVGGVKKDDVLSVQAQTKGADGAVWYQVFVDAEKMGFIRANLVSITDGSTPPALKEGAGVTTVNAAAPAAAPAAAGAANQPKAEVTEVKPTGASVLKQVRVRSDASTDSTIITTVDKGLALTVTGWATSTDGAKWWRVNFTVNGQEVTGFIRSDFVEDIKPDEVSKEVPQEPASVPQEPMQPEEIPAWEVVQTGDVWYLIDHFGRFSEDNVTPTKYKIESMFLTVASNKIAYDKLNGTAKILKAVIVALVIAMVALAAACTVLFLKWKDLNELAGFAEAERDAARRGRSADRPKSAQSGQGQRPAPQSSGQGQKPQGRPPQGRPPVQDGQGQRPQGARPSQGRPPVQDGQGQRPQGRPSAQDGQGQRPQGRPSAQDGQAQGPQEERVSQGRPSGQDGGQRPPRQDGRRADRDSVDAGAQEQGGQTKGKGDRKAGWKSKNFMHDEEEFDFEFLNWEDGDKK